MINEVGCQHRYNSLLSALDKVGRWAGLLESRDWKANGGKPCTIFLPCVRAPWNPILKHIQARYRLRIVRRNAQWTQWKVFCSLEKLPKSTQWSANEPEKKEHGSILPYWLEHSLFALKEQIYSCCLWAPQRRRKRAWPWSSYNNWPLSDAPARWVWCLRLNLFELMDISRETKNDKGLPLYIIYPYLSIETKHHLDEWYHVYCLCLTLAFGTLVAKDIYIYITICFHLQSSDLGI